MARKIRIEKKEEHISGKEGLLTLLSSQKQRGKEKEAREIKTIYLQKS